MAHYDKYEPYAGGFRALLAANFPDADLNKVVAIGLDAAGLVVKGKGNTGILAVLVISKKNKKAGAVVDNMTQGEIVEFGGVPGSVYYAKEDGTLAVAPLGVVPVGGTRIGHTAESGRLIVRVIGGAVAA